MIRKIHDIGMMERQTKRAAGTLAVYTTKSTIEPDSEPYVLTLPDACLRRLKDVTARFIASADNDDSSSRRDAGAFALHLFESISTTTNMRDDWMKERTARCAGDAVYLKDTVALNARRVCTCAAHAPILRDRTLAQRAGVGSQTAEGHTWGSTAVLLIDV